MLDTDKGDFFFLVSITHTLWSACLKFIQVLITNFGVKSTLF